VHNLCKIAHNKNAQINRSLTCSELNLIKKLAKECQKQEVPLFAATYPNKPSVNSLGYHFMYQNPRKKAFYFYSPSIAKHLYKTFQTQLKTINTYLPVREKLPLSPHCPEGYSTSWNDKDIDPKDIAITFAYLVRCVKNRG